MVALNSDSVEAGTGSAKDDHTVSGSLDHKTLGKRKFFGKPCETYVNVSLNAS